MLPIPFLLFDWANSIPFHIVRVLGRENNTQLENIAENRSNRQNLGNRDREMCICH